MIQCERDVKMLACVMRLRNNCMLDLEIERAVIFEPMLDENELNATSASRPRLAAQVRTRVALSSAAKVAATLAAVATAPLLRVEVAP